MNTEDADAFYESFERLRDGLSREGSGTERFSDAAAALEGAAGEVEKLDRLTVGDDGFVTFDGDVDVTGDVVIEDGGILYVRGNLTIRGVLIARGFFNLCVVVGTLKCDAARSSGELAALGGVDAERLFWTHGEQGGCYAPKLRTELYIAQDRVDLIEEVEADDRIQGHIGEIAYDLSTAFSTRIWANREEFELDPLRVEEFVRTP